MQVAKDDETGISFFCLTNELNDDRAMTEAKPNVLELRADRKDILGDPKKGL